MQSESVRQLTHFCDAVSQCRANPLQSESAVQGAASAGGPASVSFVPPFAAVLWEPDEDVPPPPEFVVPPEEVLLTSLLVPPEPLLDPPEPWPAEEPPVPSPEPLPSLLLFEPSPPHPIATVTSARGTIHHRTDFIVLNPSVGKSKKNPTRLNAE